MTSLAGRLACGVRNAEWAPALVLAVLFPRLAAWGELGPPQPISAMAAAATRTAGQPGRRYVPVISCIPVRSPRAVDRRSLRVPRSHAGVYGAGSAWESL